MNTISRLALAVTMSFIPPASSHQDTMNDGHPHIAGNEIGTVNFQADCDDRVRADIEHELGTTHHTM